jgi:hypothetical protein
MYILATRNTGLGVMNALRQAVMNLDSQRDQLVAAIERDYPSTVPGIYPGAEPRTNQEHQRLHLDLVDFFSELAQAREHLVQAHNDLRDVVSPIDLLRDSRR